MGNVELTGEQFEKWLAALRSGEYEQTTQYEYDCRNGTFCAMGVLGDILFGKEAAVWDPGNDGTKQWNELSELESFIEGLSLYVHVADLNDNGSNFSEIADWLETNRAAILKF